MKKRIVTAVAALAVLTFSGAAVSEVSFLRGDQDLEAMSKESSKKTQMEVQGGIERSYKIQPPAIPHKIDKDEINLKVNTCMKCHSELAYEKEKAPRIGDSHYVDRDGNILKSLSNRRYFCSQCHAPQLKATPLVENTFQGAK